MAVTPRTTRSGGGSGRSSARSGSKRDRRGAEPTRRRNDIELLRVVAVLSVLLFHFAPGFLVLPHGYLGVDMFFTISGFVITAQMLKARDRDGFTYVGFLAGRVRRLLPSAVLVIVVSMVVILAFAAPSNAESESRAAKSALLYVSNFFFAHRSVDYFAQGQESAFIHYWSLSVEEQFYVFWPAAFLLIGLVVGRIRGRFLTVLGVFAVVTAVVSLVGASIAMGDDPSRAFFMPWWRAHQLMLGAVVAIALHAWRPSVDGVVPRVRAGVVVVRVVCVLWLVALVAQRSDVIASPGWESLLVSVPVAVVLGTRWATDGDPLTRLGSLRALVWVAAASYVIYLWHWPVWLLLRDVLPAGWNGWLLIGAASAVTLVCAAVTHRFVEQPLHRGSWARSLADRRVVVAGVGSCVAVALLLGFVAPVVAQSRVGDWAGTLTPAPRAASVDRSPGYDRGCFGEFTESKVRTCVDNPGAARTVMLVGDSHAMQWQGALAAAAPAADATLITATRSGCPLPEVSAAYGATNAKTCSAWRKNLLALVAKEKPDLLVASWDTSTELSVGEGSPVTASERPDVYGPALRSALEQLVPHAGKVVVLEDTPALPNNLLECLESASKPAGCDFANAADGPDRALVRSVAGAVPGVTLVDPYPTICPEDPCRVVVGDRLRFSDRTHLANSYLLTLVPWLSGWLGPALTQGAATP